MPTQVKEKVEAFLKIASEGLSVSDFTKAFKTLTAFVQKVKDNLESRFINLEEKINVKINTRLSQIKDGYTPVKDKDYFDGKDGKNGLQGVQGAIGEQGDSITGLNGADGSPDTPKIIRDKLEFLKKEKEKLSIDAIGYLEERLTDLEENGRKLGSKVSGGGLNMGAMNLRIVDPYTPKGDLDGTNKDFELVAAPSPATSLKVYRGGRLLKLTEDYTLSGTTVSLLIAPHADDSVTVEHRR